MNTLVGLIAFCSIAFAIWLFTTDQGCVFLTEYSALADSINLKCPPSEGLLDYYMRNGAHVSAT